MGFKGHYQLILKYATTNCDWMDVYVLSGHVSYVHEKQLSIHFVVFVAWWTHDGHICAIIWLKFVPLMGT